MPIEPSQDITFASDDRNDGTPVGPNIEPTTANQKLYGYGFPEVPLREQSNYLYRGYNNWIKWLKATLLEWSGYGQDFSYDADTVVEGLTFDLTGGVVRGADGFTLTSIPAASLTLTASTDNYVIIRSGALVNVTTAPTTVDDILIYKVTPAAAIVLSGIIDYRLTPAAPTKATTDLLTANVAANAAAIATKEPIITGAATTITSSDLTPDRALISNSEREGSMSLALCPAQNCLT